MDVAVGGGPAGELQLSVHVAVVSRRCAVAPAVVQRGRRLRGGRLNVGSVGVVRFPQLEVDMDWSKSVGRVAKVKRDLVRLLLVLRRRRARVRRCH